MTSRTPGTRTEFDLPVAVEVPIPSCPERHLPYGWVEEVRRATKHHLELGREGGYIFAPAHSVEGEVPLENMLACIEVVQSQPSCRRQ